MCAFAIYSFLSTGRLASLSRSFIFFKPEAEYDMRISDWSSDVCSSDLGPLHVAVGVDEDRDAGGARPHQLVEPHLDQEVLAPVVGLEAVDEIGRESCWESVCQYV